uniref:Uncharacterized protein n=1 Tax=Magallana gigas TaxID=29159 RepID=K1R484_MAGGI
MAAEKGDCHHNMMYDLEESPRIQEIPNDHAEPAEHLYGSCSYEDTCYSTLALRVNIESVLEPCSSRQEVFNEDNNAVPAFGEGTVLSGVQRIIMEENA